MFKYKLRRFVYFLGKVWPLSAIFRSYYVSSARLFAWMLNRVKGIHSVYNTSRTCIAGVSDIDILVITEPSPSSRVLLLIKRIHFCFRFLAPMIVDLRIIQLDNVGLWIDSSPELKLSCRNWKLLSGTGVSLRPHHEDQSDSEKLQLLKSAIYYYLKYFTHLYFSGERNLSHFEFVRVANKINSLCLKSTPIPEFFAIDTDAVFAKTLLELDESARTLLSGIDEKRGAEFQPIVAIDVWNDKKPSKTFVHASYFIPRDNTLQIILNDTSGTKQLSSALAQIDSCLADSYEKFRVQLFTQSLHSAYMILNPFQRKFFFKEKFSLLNHPARITHFYLQLCRRSLIDKFKLSTNLDFDKRAKDDRYAVISYSKLLSTYIAGQQNSLNSRLLHSIENLIDQASTRTAPTQDLIRNLISVFDELLASCGRGEAI